MGLDMMLYMKRRIGNFPNDEELRSAIQNSIINNKYIDDSGIEIKYCVGYWRKCYSIDNWFAGKGERESEKLGCEAEISLRELHELKNICIEILKDKSKSKDLLPQVSFDNNESYMYGIMETLKILNNILSEADLFGVKFFYKTSW